MASIADPFTPGEITDPIAGLADPQTYNKVREEWGAFLGQPQGRAALLSAGLALMQPPSFGDNGVSQIGRAIGAAGQSATANQAMDLKESEAASKDEARSQTAEARMMTAEARANAAGARTDAAGSRMELQSERLKNQMERNNLNNRVRLSQMYQNYVSQITKQNANAKLLGQPEQPIQPIADWVQSNPLIKTMGLMPTQPVTGSEDDDTEVPAVAQTTTGGAVPPPASRVKDKVYDTPKGKLKWTGTGWVTP